MILGRKNKYTRQYKRDLVIFFFDYIKRRGVSQASWARLVGYSPTWVTRWKLGHAEVPDLVAWAIEQYDRAEDSKWKQK